MRQLRCAVIGCGRIGCGFDDPPNDKTVKTHAGSYFTNPKTKLVALCDVDQYKLQKYGKKYKVSSLYTKSSEMFRKEYLDCVSICTLVDTHLNLVKEAANHGVKGIFLEKPMSDSLQNARKIIQICKTRKITLAIDHKRRFDPFYHSIRNFIKQKKLGNIQLVNVYYGSGISNTGSHVFDILRLFFGEADSIRGIFSKNKSASKLDPNIDAVLEFRNGIICRLQALDVRYYGMLEMDIFGTSGRLRFNLETNKTEYFKTSQKNYLVYKNLVPSRIMVKRSNESAVKLGVENLASCLLSKKEPMCTGEDGYRSLELIIASIRSSEQGAKIRLPLISSNYKITSK